jgi:hypothetical protein
MVPGTACLCDNLRIEVIKFKQSSKEKVNFPEVFTQVKSHGPIVARKKDRMSLVHLLARKRVSKKWRKKSVRVFVGRQVANFPHAGVGLA